MPYPRYPSLSLTPLLSDFLTLTIDTMQVTRSLFFTFVVTITTFSLLSGCAPTGPSALTEALPILRKATAQDWEDLKTMYFVPQEELKAVGRSSLLARTKAGRLVFDAPKFRTSGTIYVPPPSRAADGRKLPRIPKSEEGLKFVWHEHPNDPSEPLVRDVAYHVGNDEYWLADGVNLRRIPRFGPESESHIDQAESSSVSSITQE